LKSSQTTERGVEEKQQDESDILIVKQLAVAGVIALRAHAVQARKQRLELLEIHQAAHALADHRTLEW
jgi:hypothetical protein